jgi:hypothetical protein
MLQALKNLEARGSLSPRPRTVLTHLAGPPSEPTADGAGGRAPPATVEGEAPATRIRPRRQATDQAANSAAPITATLLTSTVVDVAWTNPFLGAEQFAMPATAPSAAPIIAPIVAPPPPPESGSLHKREGEVPAEPPRDNTAVSKVTPAAPPSLRPVRNLANPTAAERLVARTIGDPARGQALVRLVERLHRDLEQTTSKTVLLAGIGPESSTHDTLLHIAPLLTVRCRGNVLLVDADLERRSLTESLERGQQPGLGELLRGNESASEFCQPTATERLCFLPAGLALHVDLSAATGRLEQVLEELAGEFTCVLIDGGRTPDTAVRALAPLADATYFVVQLGAVETATAETALRELRSLGARVLGSIAT